MHCCKFKYCLYLQARILMIFLNYGLVIRDPLIESTYHETIRFFADRCYFPFRYVEGIFG